LLEGVLADQPQDREIHVILIEIVFSLLQRKTLNGGSFETKDQLREAIEAFIRRHNERAKPFRWRKREVKGGQLKNTILNLRN
jgi:hypothetical protein